VIPRLNKRAGSRRGTQGLSAAQTIIRDGRLPVEMTGVECGSSPTVFEELGLRELKQWVVADLGEI